MRKYLILFLLMSLQLVAHGQTIATLDSLGLPHPTVAKSMRYWFDDDSGRMTSSDMQDSHHIIDVSALAEGLHTVNYQIIDDKDCVGIPYSSVFLKLSSIYEQSDTAVEAKKLIYWYDEQEANTIIDLYGGVQMLDASTLQEGVHTLHYMVVCSDGTVTSAYSSIFVNLNNASIPDSQESTAAKSMRYWFDEENLITETELISGPQILEVSNLSDGVHILHYQLIDNRGEVGVVASSPFVKMNVVEKGENVITQYLYWMNDGSKYVSVDIPNPSNPYQLITLVPIEKAPIRSSSFHFEVKEGEPMIYAKNDIHFRFYDAIGYSSDDTRTFVDCNVSQRVTDITPLQTSQTFERPEENGIKWFCLDPALGDSIAFRSSQATTMQVFSPSGKELYAASGDKSVLYGGCHTWEEGTHYLAVHDVTGSRSTLTLDYMHMDKYDVVSQDVHAVGNGGCSTITFQGNGFRDLYEVILYTEQGEEIHSLDIGHESDASTTVTFDFTGVALGSYDALFRFTEEDKTFAGCITVQEAKDIELSVKVSYPSRFLRGTATTYTVEITNKGNMTAYFVPTEFRLSTNQFASISSVFFKDSNGKRLDNWLFNYTEADSIEAEVLEEFREMLSNV